MKVIIPGAGLILVIMGLIWFLQGINVLPGSFMTGQSFWAWAGLASFVVGGVLLFVGLARRGAQG